MKKKLEYFIHAILPLFLGILGYYFFCPGVLFVVKVDDILPFSLHYVTNWQRNNTVKLFRNYGFDFLWAYSFFFVLHIFLGNENKRVQFMVAELFAIVMELMQLLPVISGTFDPMDCIVEGCAFLLATGVIYYQFLRRRG